MSSESLGNLIWMLNFKAADTISEPCSLKANRGGELYGQKRAERLDLISSPGKSRSVSLMDTGER